MNHWLITPTDGECTGFGLVGKVSADQFGGALFVMEGVLPPGDFVPAHTHTREDECTYIRSGQVFFEIGDEVIEASTGCYVIKPRGVRHGFWNASSEPAYLMEMHTPGAFEGYYREMGAVMSEPTLDPASFERAITAVQQRYGLIPDDSAAFLERNAIAVS